ncbi:hypothetical protein KAH55_12340, partial [bacterium]|nr:hypothetical protein [bacterium]
MSKSSPQKYQNIVQRLAQARNRQKVINCITSSIWFVAGALGLFFLAVVSEHSFQFQQSGRAYVDGIVLVLIVILLVKFIIIPLWLLLFRRKVPSLKIIALKVGEKFPTIKDRLSNAIQIYQNLTTEKNRHSKVMVLAALDAISKDVEGVHFAKVLNRSELFKSLKWGGSSLFVMLFCVLIWQAPFSQASIRLRHPLRDYSVLS